MKWGGILIPFCQVQGILYRIPFRILENSSYFNRSLEGKEQGSAYVEITDPSVHPFHVDSLLNILDARLGIVMISCLYD